MSGKSQHVVPKGAGRWSVRSTGSSRLSGSYGTREEAIARAREQAQAQHSELYIHDRDGRIRNRESYTEDHSPSKA